MLTFEQFIATMNTDGRLYWTEQHNDEKGDQYFEEKSGNVPYESVKGNAVEWFKPTRYEFIYNNGNRNSIERAEEERNSKYVIYENANPQSCEYHDDNGNLCNTTPARYTIYVAATAFGSNAGIEIFSNDFIHIQRELYCLYLIDEQASEDIKNENKKIIDELRVIHKDSFEYSVCG